jgi:DNA repair protein RecO (recombination protein O)
LSFGRNLQIVRQAEIVESFSPLREDLVRLANGLYLADLLGAFISDGDPNSDLFDLLESALRLVVAAKTPAVAARWFEIRLLDHVGYAPMLTECVYCGTDMSKAVGMFALSAAQGGVLCDRHTNVERFDDQSYLDRASLSRLQALSAARNTEELLETGLLDSPHRDVRLVSSALRRYINFRIDRALKSLVFLDTVQGTD